jgi:hypothetical protein
VDVPPLWPHRHPIRTRPQRPPRLTLAADRDLDYDDAVELLLLLEALGVRTTEPLNE